MSTRTAHSRRAIVGASAAVAAAPIAHAAAKKKGKGKGKGKKKPPVSPPTATPSPPLVSLLVTGTDLYIYEDRFVYRCKAAYVYLPTGGSQTYTTGASVPLNSSGDAVQAQLVASLQWDLASSLATDGLIVPEDRISVTIL